MSFEAVKAMVRNFRGEPVDRAHDLVAGDPQTMREAERLLQSTKGTWTNVPTNDEVTYVTDRGDRQTFVRECGDHLEILGEDNQWHRIERDYAAAMSLVANAR